MDDELNQRLTAIDQRLTTIDQRLTTIDQRLDTLSDRMGRQVAVTEALRSDMRLLTGITQSMLTAIQAMVGAYTDLSARVTDLENPSS